MNLEFHYYIVHYLCNRAGFGEEESRTIAYSSQYVDNSLVSRVVKTERGPYTTLITQNYGWWNDSFPRTVYLPFHFFPGDTSHPGSRRWDGRINRCNCTPDSPGVKRLLIAALKTRNLYRVGIALHTYADSWAHQNFSGLHEDWNMLDKNSLIPSIGHAQAVSAPDILTATWTDPRIVEAGGYVNNRERFLQAARKIYKYLAAYNHRSFDDADLVIEMLSDLIGPPGREREMSERIFDYIIAENILKYDRYEWLNEAVYADGLLDVKSEESVPSGYDKFTWLTDAVLYRSNLMKTRPVTAKNGFFSSRYYLWNEAAREHLATAQRILNEIGLCEV
jgi:hypothetical protein